MGATADAVGGMDGGIDGNPVEDRIVQVLVDKGRLKEADLGRARRLQAETGGSLLTLLSRLGLVSERDHAETVAEVTGLPLVSAQDAPDLPPDDVALSVKFMKQFHVCPRQSDAQAVELLMADPHDDYALDAVRLAIQRPLRLKVALHAFG